MRQIPVKIWLPIILVTVIIVGLAVFFTFPKEEKTLEVLAPKEILEEKITPKIPVDWEIYKNEEYGFELKYPKNAKMIEEGFIELPFTPGTTLVEKNLRIGIIEDQCPPMEGIEIRKPEIIPINEVAFTKEVVGEGAMGSFYESIRYSTIKDDFCFYLDFTLHSVNPGVFDVPPPDFDYEKETEVFDQIVSTFRFRE